MENPGQETGKPGRRQSDLKKAYKFAVRSLLIVFSQQDFIAIFSKFSRAERKMLYRLYTQVVVNLYQQIKNEFDAICEEVQVGPILDKVEQLIDEQSLDPLFSDKTNVMDVANDLNAAKKSEIQKLTSMLQNAEEHNRQMEDRISLLRKQPQEESGAAQKIEKLKAVISDYFEGNHKLPPI
ncbi:unnamed protein product [Cochlearia groenlandica]